MAPGRGWRWPALGLPAASGDRAVEGFAEGSPVRRAAATRACDTRGMEELLVRFADLAPWQIALTAAGLLLQAFVVPSLPEEIIISALGMLWSRGRIGFGEALAAALLGLLPANAGMVFLGRRFGTGLRAWPPFARAFRSPMVAAALEALRGRGAWFMLVTRFTPLVRGPVYLAAGLSGMSLRRFVLLDAAAALVHVPCLLWLGERVGRGAASMADAWQRMGWLAAGLVAIALTLHLVRRASVRARRAGHTLPP